MLFKNTGPAKGNVQMGVTATCEVPTGDILVGGGDGSLQVLRTVPEPSSTNPKLLRKMPALAGTKVEGAITSIALADMNARGFTFFVGTAMCNIYKVRRLAVGRITHKPGARCVAFASGIQWMADRNQSTALRRLSMPLWAVFLYSPPLVTAEPHTCRTRRVPSPSSPQLIARPRPAPPRPPSCR